MALKVNGQIITDSTSSYIQLPVGGTLERPSVPTTGMIRYNTSTYSAEVYSTYIQNGVTTSSWQSLYTSSGYSSTPVNGEAVFTTPTSTEQPWVVPADVTIIAVVCVGGGASGASAGAAGGGGALAYANYVSVTPGTTCTYMVGAGGSSLGSPGQNSYFKLPDGTVVCQANGGSTPGGGSFSSINGGGGTGGSGSATDAGGGGGAGGYTGSGGAGGPYATAGQSGSGGGGGGGSGSQFGSTAGGGGGGVGIYGKGTDGAGGAIYTRQGGGGSGGVGGGNSIVTGGAYGGGAGSRASPGGGGAIRIVWGPGLSNTGRQFPSNSVGAL